MAMESEIGARLRAARQEAGMSTRTVSDRLRFRGISVSHATVANYELGKSKPELALIGVLSELYGIPLNSFLAGSPFLSHVRYRALKSVKANERRNFEARAERLLRAYIKLEEKCASPLVNRAESFLVQGGDSPVEMASRLRTFLKFGDGPVASVIEILELFGIRVVEVHSDSRIDACAARLGRDKVVILNSALSNDRIRLNAVHELGHLLLEHCGRDAFSEGDALEDKAFEFGSHFLIPDSKIREAFEGYSMIRLIKFKEHFGVSLAAMVFRADKAGLLSRRIYKRLWIEFNKRGWRKQEPGVVLPDRPKRFEFLLDSAVRSGRLSMAEATRVTGLPKIELENRLSRFLNIGGDQM